jgi:ribosomal protein L40E/TM2 domain-containing membrane protein YozV
MASHTTGQETEAAAFTRCPDCGALNPVDADWCGQCARRFTAPPPPAPPEPAPDLPTIDAYFADSFDPVTGRVPHGPATVIDERDPLGLELPRPVRNAQPPMVEAPPKAPQVPTEEIRRGAFITADGVLSWTCRVCDEINPIELNSCRVCQSTFAETLRPQPLKVSGDPNTAALYSLFFPGAGHAYLGMWAQAVARAILSTWVVAVSILLLIGGGGLLAGSVFVLSSVALWITAAHDAYREASHQPALVLLHGRRFMYVTVGLLGLLFLMLLVGAATVA